MDMIFKPMDESHIDRLLKIEEKCFLGDSWTRLMFESEVKNKISSLIVALSNDEEAILGYCCVWFIADFAEITNIAVSPEFWRQGIGKTILYYIIEKSKILQLYRYMKKWDLYQLVKEKNIIKIILTLY